MVSRKQIEYGLLIALIFSTLVFRYYVLELFGFKFSDSDQAIMWNALKDFSNGVFHEPRFYGQNYNTMLEALLAVPLYKLGVEPYKAVTIVTTIISLFPFWFLSFLAYKKKNRVLGLAILSVPLLMPIEYHLMTSLSRGFITGIFIATFGLIALFYSKSRFAFYILGLVSVVGYSLTANSVLLSAPILLYVFLLNYKSFSFYISVGFGFLTGLMVHICLNHFYEINPNYKLHSYELLYSFDKLIQSFNGLDKYFNYVSPIFWNQGFIWLILLLIFGVLAFKRDRWQLGVMLLFIPFMILGTLGFSKIHDGTESIFFSYSRMYLSLPVLIAACFYLYDIVKISYLYFIVPFGILANNAFNIKSTIEKRTNYLINHVVATAEVEKVINRCDELLRVSKENHIDLIVIISDADYDFINYGCTACLEGFPETLRPIYERRTWRLLEEENLIRKNILFVDNQDELDLKFSSIDKIENHDHLYILKNNSMRTINVLREMNLNIRPF